MEPHFIPFIRHGQKLWNNGRKPNWMKGYSHDPPLNMVCKKDIQTTSLQIVAEHIPTEIISSPFLRCRQTAILIHESLNGRGIKVPVIVDSDLGEYLGNWKIGTSGHSRQIDPIVDISPETLAYIHEQDRVETMPQFEERMSRILTKNWAQKSVWVVTHGLVISTLNKLSKSNLIEIPSEAGWCLLQIS